MRLLILGGTRFIGYHLVQAAQARGHHVTLFNRGRHDPTPPPGVDYLQGDRDTDLSTLQKSINAGVKWDAVIDTSGYVPRAVRATADLLKGTAKRYVFISSASVYADFDAPSIPEDHPLGQMTDEQVAEMEQLLPHSTGSIAPFYGELYGPLKARCEQTLEEVMPGRVLVIRPGLVVGPQDYSDRFTSWVRRLHRGGQVLAPGPATQPVQFIDARDLAEWIVTMTERQETGVYNATGPATPLTMGEFLTTCLDAVGRGAQLHWVDDEFLTQQGIQPGNDLPLWFPLKAYPECRGFSAVECHRAVQQGLTFRPLTQTALDTLQWDQNAQVQHERGAGLTPDQEQELLKTWEMIQASQRHP